jgi:hypothetical protein
VTRRLRILIGLLALPFASAIALAAAAPGKPGASDVSASPSSPAATANPVYARRLVAAPVLYGHFTQEKLIQGIKKPLVSQGDFLVARGKGVIWRTQKPFAAAAAVTAKGLWALEGAFGGSREGAFGGSREGGDPARAPKRTPLHQGNLGATLGMMERVLAGDPAGLEKNFSVAAGGTDSAWTLTLTPKDPSWARFVKSVSVAGGAHVDSVAYLEANGDRTRIAFTQVEAGAGALGPWSDAAFRN